MLYKETIAVCSEIRTEHVNALYGHNVELCGTTTYHYKVNLAKGQADFYPHDPACLSCVHCPFLNNTYNAYVVITLLKEKSR